MIKDILLWIWQFPLNIAGIIYILFYYEDLTKYKTMNDCVLYLDEDKVGVTLGEYVFLWKKDSNLHDSFKHEYGHVILSRLLGPLYLFIIGIPSALWNILHKSWAPNKSYYWFYTESWANHLSKHLK